MDSRVKIGLAVLVVLLIALPLANVLKQRDLAATDALNTYSLVSVGGHALPYAPRQMGEQAPAIVSSSIFLKRDGTFVSTMVYENSTGGTVIRDFKGTYTKDGANYTLNWEGAGQNTATVEGTSFTLKNERTLYVYKR